VSLNGGVHINQDRLRCIYGTGIEEIDSALAPQSADFVVSRAVLQEIHEIDRCFAAMDRVLRAGGMLVHKIDLRDYAMFSAKGFHPLEFLTISETTYKLAAQHSGRSNRRMVDYYRRKMRDLGYSATIYATSIIQPSYAWVSEDLVPHKVELESGIDYSSETLDLVNAIRPRLQEPFRSLSDQDLMTSGIFLVARKP